MISSTGCVSTGWVATPCTGAEFLIVEDFDDRYWKPFRDHEQFVHEQLQHRQRHVYDAEMKERRRTHGHPGHEPRPSPDD
jgi:hypothetical protein